MEPITKEEENTIKEKLEYIGLDLQEVPEFFIEDFRPLEFRPSNLYMEETERVYAYLDVRDIQIMLTTTNPSEGLKGRYQQADSIYFYMAPETEEDIIKHSMFLKMLQTMQIPKIQEVEKEQEKLTQHMPFEVKYPKSYSWHIYYAEESKQYFMLVSVEEQDTSPLFYLLKEQVEARKQGIEKKIYVPISNKEYSREYLKKSEMQDIEKYLWLFTKDWPITYEVYNLQGEKSIQIVGNTIVYEKIHSKYNITLSEKEEAIRFYKLLKALFILQTELSHEYDFEVMISEKGDLEFLYNHKIITYESLSRFIKKEHEQKQKQIKEMEQELSEVEQAWKELKQQEEQAQMEYKKKEAQIATFLEYRRTFFGRIRYFFRKGKKSKTQEETVKPEQPKEETKRETIPIEEKDYYTIEDLLTICKMFENLNTELKNKKLDKTALEYKVKSLLTKLKNANQYIEEIDEHKKSLLEFWKFANKDTALGLAEGKTQENKVEQKKMKKIFDYEEDFEDLGMLWDKYQKQELKKEECDSVYLATTSILSDWNQLKQGKNEENKLKQTLELLKEKASSQLLGEEEFDIFGSVSEDHTKIKTLGNKKHRESKKSEIRLLDILRSTTVEGYKQDLEKYLQILEKALGHVHAVADISIYLAQENVLNTEELGIFHINPKYALEEKKECEKINLYRMNLKQGMPAIACSNSIFYDNKNQTLPDGMDVGDKVLVDMSQFHWELKKQRLFRLNQEIDEFHRKNKIVCVYEYDVEIRK